MAADPRSHIEAAELFLGKAERFEIDSNEELIALAQAHATVGLALLVDQLNVTIRIQGH